MSDRELLRRTWFQEFQHFFRVWDERFEDYHQGWLPCLTRDAIAAIVVALVAIPLGIGFSIASGMRPETGIVAGAIAGIIGGLFGGSKYQVYGPTAAFIPIISGIVHKFDVPFLILCSVVAGLIIMIMGVARLGQFFSLVPHSVIVGFTIGIACTIVISQLANILGETNPIGQHVIEKLSHLPDMFVDTHAHALIIAIATFFFVRQMNRISVFIPAALIAMATSTFVANQIWHDHMIPVVSTLYGDIGGHMLRFTPPSIGAFTLTDMIVPVFAIVFVGALEGLLSSRMADRLASNKTAYNPNKELFGQGIVNVVVPLLNGFPCTGALARTATNIKVGAVSPLASILKGISVLLMMMFGASYLSTVPMAFVGGLLIYVASNMVKPHEVRTVFKQGTLHVFLMAYTALVTLLADLSSAVISATVIYYTLRIFIKLDHDEAAHHHHGVTHAVHESSRVMNADPASQNAGTNAPGVASVPRPATPVRTRSMAATVPALEAVTATAPPSIAADNISTSTATPPTPTDLLACPQCGYDLNQTEA